MTFEGFPKIARYHKDIIITEKIDGTNAQIYISFDNTDNQTVATILSEVGPMSIWAGSRSRWITPGNDNFGFAAWVRDNAEELIKLGPGKHFGEWWGRGIQRGYGLNERRFSLFNVFRWNGDTLPKCCHVVPKLYQGPWLDGFRGDMINWNMIGLKDHGSYASPGFNNPEGIVIYHTGNGVMFKHTFEHTEGKWKV